MRIPESCAKCLYDKQVHRVNNEEYLYRVREIINSRKDTDTSPYLVYLFNRVYKEMFESANSYSDIKKKYNDLVLGLENDIRNSIKSSPDPLATSLQYARIGNYIDFGAMNNPDENEFLSLFEKSEMSENDRKAYRSFVSQCKAANSFLLISDNCGEIVLDKLFIEQLKKTFPHIEATVLVRGGEVLNDATVEDAEYSGIHHIARIIDNGLCISGTVYDLLPEEAKECLNNTDVILAKGQGNYESLSGEGRHIFYSFLCKCDLFINRFHVPRLTGIFIEE